MGNKNSDKVLCYGYQNLIREPIRSGPQGFGSKVKYQRPHKFVAGNQTKMLTCNPTSLFKTYQNLKSHDSKPKFSNLPNSRNKKKKRRVRDLRETKHYIKIMLESKDPAIKLFGMKIPLSSTVFEAEEDELSAEQVLILALLQR